MTIIIQNFARRDLLKRHLKLKHMRAYENSAIEETLSLKIFVILF